MTVLLVQQPQVTVSVSRDSVRVGDDVIVTIIVQAPGDAPIEIVDPELTGLRLRNASSQSQFTITGNVGSRTTTRTLTVQAQIEGEAVVGPVIVRQGTSEISTSATSIVVQGILAAGARRLAPRVVALLSSMEPEIPSPEEVTLTVSAMPNQVTLGEQVDVIIAAWVPREIRSRLRNPPTLETPQVRGAWAYRQPTPPGIALSRDVGGIAYDVFVQHDVIFPLTAGSARIGEAKVSYSLPLSYSFLSRELRHEVRSEPLEISVAPQPTPSEGIVFGGATGTDLTFEIEPPPRQLAIGDAARVEAVIRGNGNVALWPEPDLRWPSGLRAYPQGVDVRLSNESGSPVGGEKTFNYLVVADSVGQHRVGIRPYVYFDVGDDEYRELNVPALEFNTPGSRLVLANRGEGLPPLLPVSALPRADAVMARLSVAVIIMIVVVPPLLAGSLAWGRRRPLKRRTRPPSKDFTTLQGLDAAFRRLLESLVPHATERSGSDLADALRAAGIEPPLASHAARLRDRLSNAVYGPEDLLHDSDELALEIREVIGALTAEERPVEKRVSAAIVAICLMIPAGVSGQSAEELYRAGAARAAADSLTERADREPLVAEHWYNLGNAMTALGEPVYAQVAWIRAARLAPRNDAVRRALQGTTSSGIFRRPDRIWIAPLTAAEAYGIGAALWIAAWALVMMRRRWRVWVPVLALAIVVVGIGFIVAARYAEPVALVLKHDTGLRPAPFGPAPLTVRMEAGTPVRIEREEGHWILVRVGPDRGWMRRAALARV